MQIFLQPFILLWLGIEPKKAPHFTSESNGLPFYYFRLIFITLIYNNLLEIVTFICFIFIYL